MNNDEYYTNGMEGFVALEEAEMLEHYVMNIIIGGRIPLAQTPPYLQHLLSAVENTAEKRKTKNKKQKRRAEKHTISTLLQSN